MGVVTAMREIRFRGKCIPEFPHPVAKWVYGSFVSDKLILSPCKERNENRHFWYMVDPDTVGQFTGLKDPTGKEIYEGDILECLALDDGPFVVRVVFRNGAFHTDVHDGVNGANFTCLLADFVALGDVRIVGNIWDGYPKFVSIEGIGGFEK